jgi:hypothetical protein
VRPLLGKATVIDHQGAAPVPEAGVGIGDQLAANTGQIQRGLRG